ncbi:hypothetical protein Tco_0508588 [Tanacetum coccineum]
MLQGVVKETNVNAEHTDRRKQTDHRTYTANTKGHASCFLIYTTLSSSSQSIDNKDADEVLGKGDDDLNERKVQEKEEGASNKEDDQHVQDFKAKLDNLLVQAE